MVFVQYYHKGAVSGALVAACGDRAVVILDGRNSLSIQELDAARFNGYGRPRYEAYSIHKGRGFNDCKAITPVIKF